MMQLTETFINQVIPPPPAPNGKGAQAFYRDSTLIGFALRVGSGGTKSYILERRIRGKVKRITLGRCDKMELARARARAERLIGQIERENAPRIINGRIVDEDISLSAAFSEYLAAHPNLSRLTMTDYRRSMRGPLKGWQSLPLRDLTESMILTKHETCRQRYQARFNNAMRLLRAILNHVKIQCITADHKAVIKANPVDVLSRYDLWYPAQTSLAAPRLATDQLKAWWRATQQLRKHSTRDYLHFLLLTGLPPALASQLTFDDVDFDRKTIRVRTKDSFMVLPLTSYLSGLIHDRVPKQGHSTTYIFPGRTKETPLSDPRTAIKRVQKPAGVRFTLKGLHRTFMHLAEQAAMHQPTLKLISELYNKKHAAVTERDIDMIRRIQERVFLNVFFIIGANR